MSENPKEEIIEKAYKEFFGSITDTFKEVRKSDKSITLADVKTWFNNKFARKTKPLQNSYIANHAYEEYQMDLFFMKDTDGDDYNTGFLLIDIFTIRHRGARQQQAGGRYPGSYQGRLQEYGEAA